MPTLVVGMYGNTGKQNMPTTSVGMAPSTQRLNEMPSQQINITLGTAGHIDHGKTALIKCLTGRETDRLKAVATELRRLGAQVQESDDCLLIEPG